MRRSDLAIRWRAASWLGAAQFWPEALEIGGVFRFGSCQSDGPARDSAPGRPSLDTAVEVQRPRMVQGARRQMPGATQEGGRTMDIDYEGLYARDYFGHDAGATSFRACFPGRVIGAWRASWAAAASSTWARATAN